MNSEIIAFACARIGGTLGFKSNDCGWRGMLGGVANRFSCRNSHASATPPTPIALRARNWRRDQYPVRSVECAVILMGFPEVDDADSERNSNGFCLRRLMPTVPELCAINLSTLLE